MERYEKIPYGYIYKTTNLINGKTIEYIANFFGVSKNTIFRVLRKDKMERCKMDISSMFTKGLTSVVTEGETLKKDIEALSNNKGLNQTDLLKIQYRLGMYNAKVEALSSITKSLLETVKSLAQRQG